MAVPGITWESLMPVPSLRINGLNVYSSDNYLKSELKGMCRSKKKRIRKKWLKNSRNYITVPDRSFYQTPLGIFCHTIMVPELQRAAELSGIEPGS